MPASRYFFLVHSLAWVSLKADAAKMYLSYAWWILEPLIWVAIFYLVFGVLLDRRSDDLIAFLLVGKFPFFWFSKSVTAASNSLLAYRGVIATNNIPRELFVFITLQECIYKQLVVFMVLGGFLVSLGYTPNPNWLWFLPLVALQYVMIVPVALMGALLVSWVRDFQMLIPLAMALLMFTSGIFWDINSLSAELQEWVKMLNPLAVLLDNYRSVLLRDGALDYRRLLIYGLSAFGLTVLMLATYTRLHSHIVRRVING